MPELPEVEAVCRRVRADAQGARVIQMRVERAGIVRPQKASRLESQVSSRILERVERRGKNILLYLSGDMVLHVHLRMTGNLYVIPDVRFRAASVRVWWELEGGRGLVFDDSRALGKVHLYAASEIEGILSDVGLEPLSPEFTVSWLMEMAGRSRKPAKLFLMDQRYIAGLGNIYVAEALFRARVHPLRPVNELRRPKLVALHAAIREVMVEAMDSAVLAYAEPGRFNEGESFPCAVYDREGEPCVRCGKRIKRIAQGGRSTYFCNGCQR